MHGAIKPAQTIDSRDWALLVLLSVLWGGSFFFVGVAIRELPPMTIVFCRAAIAALALWLVVRVQGVALPSRVAGWTPFIVMASLNFVVPFSLLVLGQTMIASSLASIINATTPLFTVVIMSIAGEERLIARRIAGVVTGLVGVVILRGIDVGDSLGKGAGVALCLGAALSYGLSALYARRRLAGQPPLVMASCQMIAASVMTCIIAAMVDRPWSLPAPGMTTMMAIIALGILSTALGYVLFFKIVARSGASNVMLVTLLVPVSAILLGQMVLGEVVDLREYIGAIIIGAALIVMDGRLFRRFNSSSA